MPRDEFESIVKESSSIAEIIRTLGYQSTTGSIFGMIKERCSYDDISLDHIPKGVGHNKGRRFGNRGFPLEQILVENSTYTNRSNLKQKLFKANMIENVCAICGQEPFWKGKKMTLILDHINGINNDHRIENLRLVCPNCNSQLPTTGSKNFKWNKSI